MKYYGKPKIEKIEHRLCEYIRCDNCNKKLEEKEKYFSVRTGHHDWGNDSIDSNEYFDICENCVLAFTKKYIKETQNSNTAYIELETEIFYTNNTYYGEYDKCEDELVENDKKEN